MGPNGCGKSTLTKLFNGLLIPTSGDVYINGINTKDENELLNIKKTVGMVFQNPDNQLISSTVEEEIAFGLENLRVPSSDMPEIIDKSLQTVGLQGFEKRSTYSLSGGQKQRLAIASILAMNPKVIVLDEPTSMLDPEGRKDILKILKKLNKNQKITIVLVTHYIEEALISDKVIVMDNGKTLYSGSPSEVFSNQNFIKSNKFVPLDTTNILYFLKEKGYDVSLKAFESSSCANEIIKVKSDFI